MLGTIDPSSNTDYYKVFLNAGQSMTAVAAGQNGGMVAEGLYDSSGNLLALPSGVSESAGPLNFSGGFSGASSLLALNGNANISGSNLDLIDGGYYEAGSAFSKSVEDVASFQTSFNFQVLQSYSYPLADGFTFTIQGSGTSAGHHRRRAGIREHRAKCRHQVRLLRQRGRGERLDGTVYQRSGSHRAGDRSDRHGREYQQW